MTAKETAWGQLVLSFSFVGGYFAVLGIFLLGYAKVAPDYKEALIALLGVITGGVGTVLAFWFSRQRSNPTTPGV